MYSLVCNESGGVLDDIIVSRFEKYWFMVCNASNREKLLAWFNFQIAQNGDQVDIEDETLSTAMVAIQGPKAVEFLDGVLPEPVSGIKRYHFQQMRYAMLVPVLRLPLRLHRRRRRRARLRPQRRQHGRQLPLRSEERAFSSPRARRPRCPRHPSAPKPACPSAATNSKRNRRPPAAGLGWAGRRPHQRLRRRRGLAAKSTPKVPKAKTPRRSAVDNPALARQGMPIVLQGDKPGSASSPAAPSPPPLKRCIAMAYVGGTSPLRQHHPSALDCRGTPHRHRHPTPLLPKKSPKAK